MTKRILSLQQHENFVEISKYVAGIMKKDRPILRKPVCQQFRSTVLGYLPYSFSEITSEITNVRFEVVVYLERRYRI